MTPVTSVVVLVSADICLLSLLLACFAELKRIDENVKALNDYAFASFERILKIEQFLDNTFLGKTGLGDDDDDDDDDDDLDEDDDLTV